MTYSSGLNYIVCMVTEITTEWFSRYGDKHTGSQRLTIDPAKGTASYKYIDTCSRCGGHGGWKGWPGFTCYDCAGNGKGKLRTQKLYTAEKLAKLNVTKAKLDAVKQAKQALREAAIREKLAQAVAAFTEAHSAFLAQLMQYSCNNAFLADLLRQFEQRGSLTGAQIAAAQKTIDTLAARVESRYIGTVGQRVELTVTVDAIIRLESNMPSWMRCSAPSIYICHDGSGNKVVYRGTSHIASKGEQARLKATIDRHEEYQSEAQTCISRPKVLEAPPEVVA